MIQELPNSKRTVHSKCCKASIILGGQIIAPYSYKCSKCGKKTELEYDVPQNAERHGEDLRIPVEDSSINDIRRTLMRQRFLDLREKLAEQEHERWTSWQIYLHNCLLKDHHGDFILPQEKYYQWDRQIGTPYSELSEKEKESDREQVDRYWPLIEEILKVLE